MIFDTHTHISRKKFFRNIESSKKDSLAYEVMECTYDILSKRMLKNNITKSVIFPFPFEEADLKQTNNYIVEAYNRNRELFVPFFLIGDDIDDSVIKQNRVMGFKEHFCLGKYEDQKYFNEHYDYLQQNKLFLLIHPHMSERISKIKYLKKTFPDLKVILAHSGRKWPFTGDEVYDVILPELSSYKNLYFDTSCLRDHEVIGKTVNKYGSDRFLFGSDYPYYQQKDEDIYKLELNTILEANITDAHKEDILMNNFNNLFLGGGRLHYLRCVKSDKEDLMELIDGISEEEKKFLAINSKFTSIKQNIGSQNHIIVAKQENRIIGFVREGGRPGNTAIIEEIYIDPDYRNRGIAGKLISIVRAKFESLEAKTFSDNEKINTLFQSAGGEIVKKSPKGNIYYWKI